MIYNLHDPVRAHHYVYILGTEETHKILICANLVYCDGFAQSFKLWS
jgi:hypothetical protein